MVQAALFDVGEAHEPRAGNGHGKSAAALLEAPLLADHLVGEVPGEEDEAVDGALLQAFHGMDGNRVAGSEEPVLVRAPVHDEFQLRAGETADAHQHVALGRRAIARDAHSPALEVPDELADLGRQGPDPAGEGLEAARLQQAAPLLGLQERSHRVAPLPSRALPLQADHQRSAVHPDALHVVQLETGRFEQADQRPHGEVRQVLVVDRVELEELEEIQEVGHLDEGRAARREDGADAGGESPQVRHVREHVSREQQVRFAMLPPERLRERLGEELRDRRDALPPRLRGDVARGLDTQHPDGDARERLQDGAVVARDLHDQAVARQAHLAASELDQLLGVLDHGLRGAAEVDVVLEQLPRRDAVAELHVHAASAATDLEWVARLGLRRARILAERVDERNPSEVEEPDEVSVPADETATEGLDQLRQYRLTLRTRSR